MILRQISADARDAAAQQAVAWGYPRPITSYEKTSRWFMANDRLGGLPKVIFWFTDGPSDRSLCLHAITQPGTRLPQGSVDLTLIVAGLLDADRVHVALEGDFPGVPVAALRRYLRIRGWKEDGLGVYKDLGG